MIIIINLITDLIMEVTEIADNFKSKRVSEPAFIDIDQLIRKMNEKNK